ncbi:MAG: hypothetical protein ACO3XN_06775 [Chthoniobacterales bacterium]
MFEKIGGRWRHAGMDDFDVRGHSRLVGNVLIALGLFALGIALAGWLPDDIFALRPHYFGDGGAAVIGVVFLLGGFWLRK